MVNKRDAKASSHGRLKPIMAGLAGILGITSPATFATVFVTNCEDSGTGSLRNAVASAPSDEVVDATALAGVCSKITLKTGAINVTQDDLYILGPGVDKLSVAADYADKYQHNSRIFTHTGHGFFALYDITVTEGYAGDPVAKGGCIYSRGAVILTGVRVTACVARSTGQNGIAMGGGVFAAGQLSLRTSSLTFNRAEGAAGYAGYGGASHSYGFDAFYSSVVGNTATSSGVPFGQYGGVDSYGGRSSYLFNSTVAFNTASGNVGGLGVVGTYDVKIVNSTISSNTAGQSVGGVFLQADSIKIFNSTISANTAQQSVAIFTPGLSVEARDAYATFTMESTIVANNLYGSPPSTESDFSSDILVTGSNNLIEVPNSSVPSDTIVGKCAFLGKLKDNGGLTLTQAVLGHSPALDSGNNKVNARFDQRGAANINDDQSYPRVLGPPATPARADIGAYEVNRDDEIYDADFDSC